MDIFYIANRLKKLVPKASGFTWREIIILIILFGHNSFNSETSHKQKRNWEVNDHISQNCETVKGYNEM
jgi:hypothetical protein